MFGSCVPRRQGDILHKAILRLGLIFLNYHDRIIQDPKTCGGQPVFKGRRFTLRTVLASLADGDSIEEILADFHC